ncbi:PHB depolymerase family esterase [Vampirovibrio sp.]|uniref:alpha/beta hydrolase family esterase n=1 Tax=Vampirovibrio sp. TaxID=2717857 RepID=UPI0035930CA3
MYQLTSVFLLKLKTIASLLLLQLLLTSAAPINAVMPRIVLPPKIIHTEESIQSADAELEPTTGEFNTKDGLTINETLLVDSLIRKTIVHLPKHYEAHQKRPLVIVLHGAKLSGWIAQAVTGFDKLANEEHFIVAYPDALHQQWNDGRRAGDTPSYGIDDVHFISTLIDYMAWKYNIDPDQVYVAGYSSGGMLAQKLGLELTHKISAIAEVSASLPINQLQKNKKPSRPISLLMINGTADRAFPWDGGSTRIIRISVGEVAPIMTTFDYWVEANGGPSELPQRKDALQKKVGGTKVSLRNTRTQNGKCVMLYQIHGGGHTWPGSEVPLRYIPFLGRQSRNLNASELIWEFFKRNQQDCQPI